MQEIFSILDLPKANSSSAKSFIQESPPLGDAPLAEIHFDPIDLDVALNSAHRTPPIQRKGTFLLGSPSQMDFVLRCLNENKEKLREWAWLESGRSGVDFEAECAALTAYLRAFSRAPAISTARAPRGVCAVISSSVWPLFYTTQFVLTNLAVGNKVIVKPSEKTSCLTHFWISCLKSQMPEGVSLQVLLGGPEVGRRLACHETVDLVIFQGTYEVGMRLKQDLLPQPSKELLLYLGSKNPLVFTENVGDKYLEGAFKDAFLGSGQNCLSAPLLFVKDDLLNPILTWLSDRVQSVCDESVSSQGFLSLMQGSARMDRYLKFLSVLEREGAESICKGGKRKQGKTDWSVKPQLSLFSDLQAEEIKKLSSFHTDVLGPHLTVVRYRNADELEAYMSQLSYGHTCGWFSNEESVPAWISRNFGRIRRNGSLYEVDFWKSPLARKRSGNHATYGAYLVDQISVSDTIE